MRDGEDFLITPSGIDAEKMDVDSMVCMQMDGSAEAHKKPYSEWRFYRDIFQQQPNVNAVVHTHSMFATQLPACTKISRLFII